MKINNKKEEIVYDILKKLFPTDVIKCQVRIKEPFSYSYIIKYDYWEVATRGRKSKKIHVRRKVTRKPKYIKPDFFNVSKNLMIEVDNMGHASPDARRYDNARDEALRGLGYRVLRIPYDVGFAEGAARLLKEVS